MLTFFTASYQQLLWTLNSIGVLEGPLGRVWLSLPPLVSNCLGLYWRLYWPPGRWTQLSYIMVQRPLDLWNRMFDRHQAEITVMQFRCHSLPVHSSISGIFGRVKMSKHNILNILCTFHISVSWVCYISTLVDSTMKGISV